jgi:hypothetical protein
MKEQNLIDLGFKKEVDEEDDFYYYTLNIGNDYTPLCLISDSNDEAKNNEWKVSIFDYESIEFSDYNSLRSLIELLQNNIK